MQRNRSAHTARLGSELFLNSLFTVKVKSSFLSPRHEMEEPSLKYILLCDRLGHVVEKDSILFALFPDCTPIQVLRGEILEGVPKADQPTDFTKVAVVGIKRKSLRLECPMEDVTRLSEEESNLLLAITSPEGRYQMYTDRCYDMQKKTFRTSTFAFSFLCNSQLLCNFLDWLCNHFGLLTCQFSGYTEKNIFYNKRVAIALLLFR